METKQITLRIESDTWKLFKKRAIDHGITLNDLADKLIRKELGLPTKWEYKTRESGQENI